MADTKQEPATDEPTLVERLNTELLGEIRDELVAIREAFEGIAVAVAGMGAMFGGNGPALPGGGFLGG